jgi:hypothetical protein
MTSEWTCVCDNEHCPDDGYCTTSGSCYTFIKEGETSRGCLDKGSARLQCESVNSHRAKISCCAEQLCNHEVDISLPTHPTSTVLSAKEKETLTIVASGWWPLNEQAVTCQINFLKKTNFMENFRQCLLFSTLN